jgi:hypothetical protein
MSGNLRIKGEMSGYSQLAAPQEAGNQTFTFPTTGGTLATVAQDSVANVGGYQQGTWTPVLSRGGYDLDPSRNVWSRIGNTIILSGYMNNLSSTAGYTIEVSGAPYNTVGTVGGSATSSRIASSPGGITQCYIRDSDSAIIFLCTTDSKSDPWVSPKYSDATTSSNGVYFSVTYITDDTTWTPQNGAIAS